MSFESDAEGTQNFDTLERHALTAQAAHASA
jgi:hypothetical protein